MNVLELFAGSRSVGKVAEARGHRVFSVDIQPFEGIDLVGDILDISVDDIPFVPDVVWASPPCTTFSVASCGHHWNLDKTPKTENARQGIAIVQKTLDIIDHFAAMDPSMKWFIENPRGMLRTRPEIAERERVTVMYCRYGDTRMKPTDIWSNHLFGLMNTSGWRPRDVCWNGNKGCHHEAAPRGSRTGTQGLKGAYDRSKIPTELVTEILDSV